MAAEGTTNFIAPQAGSTAFDIRCSDSKAIIWSYELVLKSRETICIASISPDIAFAAKAAGAGEIGPSQPYLLKNFAIQNSKTQRGSLANSCGPRTGVPRPLDLASCL